MQKVIVPVVAFLMFSPSLTDLEAQETPKYRVEALAMRDCLLRAVQYNLDIETEGYNPKLKEFDLTLAQSAFDPALTSSFSYVKSEKEQTSVFAPKAIQQVVFDVGFQKKHLLGGTVGLSYTIDYTDQQGNESFQRQNPTWEHGISLKVTQPLLRNLGMDTNLTQIRIAQNSLDSSFYGFYSKVLSVVAEVQKSYWDLVNARENYELQRQSLELAENLYKITLERIKVGSLAAAESLEAESNVAFKQDNLVVAGKNVDAAEDKLKQLIRPLDINYYKDVRLIPTERPVLRELTVDFEEILRYALDHRPDILQSKLNLQNASYQVEQGKNQLLPKLDFSGSIGLSGVATNSPDAWEPVRDWDFPRWQVGLTLEIPLGNRAASSQYQKYLLQREKSLSEQKNLESAVVLEIRQTTRDLLTAMRRVETAKRTRELAEKQLLNEENKFRVGLIALFQVQDTEQKLTEARIREITALLDYQRALVALDKAKGALWETLGRYGIESTAFSMGARNNNQVK